MGLVPFNQRRVQPKLLSRACDVCLRNFTRTRFFKRALNNAMNLLYLYSVVCSILLYGTSRFRRNSGGLCQWQHSLRSAGGAQKLRTEDGTAVPLSPSYLYTGTARSKKAGSTTMRSALSCTDTSFYPHCLVRGESDLEVSRRRGHRHSGKTWNLPLESQPSMERGLGENSKSISTGPSCLRAFFARGLWIWPTCAFCALA